MKGNSPRVVMAFDFGLKNIGIAIGQEITKTASTFYSINVGPPPSLARLAASFVTS